MSGKSGDSGSQLLDSILDNFTPKSSSRKPRRGNMGGDRHGGGGGGGHRQDDFEKYQEEKNRRFVRSKRERHQMFSELGTMKEFTEGTKKATDGPTEFDHDEVNEIMKKDVPELSSLAQITGIFLRRDQALRNDAAKKSPYYSHIQTGHYTPMSPELGKIMKNPRGSNNADLWSYLENQKEVDVKEDVPDTMERPQTLEDKLSEVRAQLGVKKDDGKRMAMGNATRRSLERKMGHVKFQDELEGSVELSRWSHMLERSMANKVYGGMDQYKEAKKQKLRAQYDRPSTKLPEEEYNKEAAAVVSRIEEVGKLEQREKAWKSDLKEPVLREFLSRNEDNDLLKQIEREVEEKFNKLEKDEFDSVFQRERVLNARLKTDAMRLLDPVAAERMPIGSGNLIDTRTVLDQLDGKVAPKYQAYTYLSTLFGDVLSSESKDEIKSYLQKMDESDTRRLHVSRKEGMSDRARMLLLPEKLEEDVNEASARLSEFDISSRAMKLKKLAQMQKEETMVNDIREHVQEIIDNRQEGLRIAQGIKTGRRGRSPVVIYPFREEEAILAINGDLNKEFPDLNSTRAQAAISNQLPVMGSYDRVDKKMINEAAGFMSYMQKHRRRFRTNRRRVAHARLMNTLKAFTWLRKYNKF